MNRPTDLSHTTLVVMMSDGSHRTTNWYRAITWGEAVEQLVDFTRHTLSKVTGAVLVCRSGVTQYTASEVREFVDEHNASKLLQHKARIVATRKGGA